MKHTIFLGCIGLFLLFTACRGDKPETAAVDVQPEIVEVENVAVTELATAREGRLVLLIPSSSVFMRGQLEGVQVVGDDNIVSIRWIRTGKVSGDNVEVLSGLGMGEKVVVPYVRGVQEGFQITVKP